MELWISREGTVSHREIVKTAIEFTIDAGPGNDRIYGSPYSDVIRGGNGFDLIVGAGGADEIDGDNDSDLIIGGEIDDSNVALFDRYEVVTVGTDSFSNDTLVNATELEIIPPTAAEPLVIDGLSLHDSDAGDWYLLPLPSDPTRIVTAADVTPRFKSGFAQAVFNLSYLERTLRVFPAAFDTATQSYLPTAGSPEKYLVHLRNPMASAVVAELPPQTGLIESGGNVPVRLVVEFDSDIRQTIVLPITVAANLDGPDLADVIRTAFQTNFLRARLSVHYHPESDRIVLQSLDGSDIRIGGVPGDLIGLLGFSEGQRNDRRATSLGKYSLQLPNLFPSSQTDDDLPIRPFTYAMATPDLQIVAPATTTDLSDPDLGRETIRRIEGDTSQENLSQVISIGDLNGDGRTDTMLVGSESAYVIFGDLDPSVSIDSISESADLILDLKGGFQLIPGNVDLNNDGFADLAVWRTRDASSGPDRVEVSILSGHEIVAAGLTSAIGQPRPPGQRVFPVELYERQFVSLRVSEPVVAMDFQWLQYSDDGIPDLMAMSRTPIVEFYSSPLDEAVMGYGYVLDGEQIAQRFVNTVSSNDMYYAFVRATRENAFPIDPAAVAYSEELHAEAGDFDGDGQDEIALTRPRGWKYDSSVIGKTVIATRTYLMDTDGARDSNVSLATDDARVVLQDLDFAAARGDGFDIGAVNVDDPLLVKDVNQDGVDDLFVFADSVQLGANDKSTLIYFGQSLASANAPLGYGDANRTVGSLPGGANVLEDLSVSVGDFDGNGLMDLAYGQPSPRSGTSSVAVVYDVMRGPDDRQFSDQFGDARIDSLLIESIGTGEQFGNLTSRSFDVTGDRIDDLLIGASRYDTSRGVVDGGAMFVIEGAPRRLQLPSENVILDVANGSITGRGDIVSGPEVIESPIVLTSGEETDWIRFTTVGDGSAGDYIHLNPGPVAEPTVLLTGVAGDVTNAGVVRTNQASAIADADAGQAGVIEFDLSRLLSAYEDSNEILSASLRLSGTASATVEDALVPYLPDQLTRTEPGGGFSEQVFFDASSDEFGDELWVSDGTPGGTRQVIDLSPGSAGSFPTGIVAVGHRVMFTTSDDVGGDVPLQRLYLSDGVTTTEVPPGALRFWSIDESTMTEHEGNVYFEHLGQLCRVVISPTGDVTAELIKDATDGFPDFEIDRMESTYVGLFVSRPVATGQQLWITDGTTGGTVMLGQFRSGERPTLVGDQYSVEVPGGILFAADDGKGAGSELWFSDGTPEGTQLLHDVNVGPANGILYGFERFAGLTFFIANETELWQSDSTSSGTKKTRDLFSSSRPLGLASVSTLVTPIYHVAAADVDGNAVTLTATSTSGSEVNSHSITAGQFVHLRDINAVGDRVLVSYESRETGVATSTESVAVWDPATDTLTVLASDSLTGKSFRDIVAIPSRNTAMFTGYINGNVLRDQVWVSDLTLPGTNPLFTQNAPLAAAPPNVDLIVDLVPGSNGQVISADDLSATPIFSTTVSLSETESDFSIELTEKEIGALRAVFDLGYRSLSAVFRVADGTAEIADPKVDSGYGLEIERRSGATAVLLDEEGRVLAEDFAHHDLRHLKAGTYYLGVSRADRSQSSVRVPVTVRLSAPLSGSAHPIDDNDRIRGGEGSDVIVGGFGLDRLFGQSGEDTFISEFFETRDRTDQETVRDGLRETTYADSQSYRSSVDAKVVVAATEIPEGAINIVSPLLAGTIADALGTRLVETGGVFAFEPAVYETDLASITSLDTSDLGLTSFDGAQYLIGLQTLDVSGNGTLSNGALTRLRPAELGSRGAAHLRHLNLDDNRISSTANLAALSSLRVLSVADQAAGLPIRNLDGLGNLSELAYVDVSGNEIADVNELASLTNLRAADLSDNPVTDAAPVSGVFIVDAGLEHVGPTGRWLYSENGDAVDGSSFIGIPSPGVELLSRWPAQRPAPGFYDVFASWNADPSHDREANYQVLHNGQLTKADIDQRFAIESGIGGGLFGGIPFGYLTTIEVTSSSSDVTISLSGTGGGTLVADAIMLRPTDFDVGTLRRIDARGTMLDSNSRTVIADDLSQRGVVFDIDPNAPPVWSNVPREIAFAPVAGHSFGDLNDLATDPDGTSLSFSIDSDEPTLTLLQNGTDYKFTVPTAIDRPIQVLLTATDADGLSSTQPITVVAGASLVTGRVATKELVPVESGFVPGSVKSLTHT